MIIPKKTAIENRFLILNVKIKGYFENKAIYPWLNLPDKHQWLSNFLNHFAFLQLLNLLACVITLVYDRSLTDCQSKICCIWLIRIKLCQTFFRSHDSSLAEMFLKITGNWFRFWSKVSAKVNGLNIEWMRSWKKSQSANAKKMFILFSFFCV